MGKYIGIDLGTTFSCMAFIDQNGLPVVIPNAEGKNITPSVVLFTEDETIVGEQAKKKSISKPLQCEQFVKRHMAERDYFFSPGNNESYTPEEISAIILRKMKADAEEFLGESVDGAVITVPAYFNDAQRIATQDAGRIAGLNVIAVINEPTAASISFGLSKNMKSETESKTMVFDLGGGTFDVTVIRIDGENIQVMATAGDRKFGGYDFDKLIIDDAIQKAQQEGIDIEADLNARQDLQLQAEEAKKTLSSSKKASIDLYVKGRSFEYKITRDYFNDIANGLLMRCLASIETVVEEAGIEYSDLDKVLLVGGSTRMPMIRDLIFEETGINPSSEVHPDEAVAIGAAYHAVDVAKKMASKANNKSRHDSAVDNREKTELTVDAQSLPEIPRNYKFTDVTSHGIGIVCTTNSGEINSVILPANTPVPASNTQYYQTMEPYQESLLIKITQGEEEDLRYVSIIGDSTVNIEPREKLANIEVTISCDENSIIHVRVYDCDYKRSLGEIKIDRVSNLTEEQIRTNQNKIHKLNIGEDD